MSAEVWLPVVGYEGAYEVSSHGRVRGLDRLVQFGPGKPGWKRGTLIAPHFGARGHCLLGLNRDGKRTSAWVHRLVMAAFVGPLPEGQEVRHLDGDPTNNRVGNLAYGTHSQNMRDAVVHGTHNEARKTECIHGHAFTPANTRIDGRGARECRECRARRNRAVGAKRTEERAVQGRSQFLRVVGPEVLVEVRELYATTQMTQKEIARHLGIAQSTVSRWVRGQTRPDLAGPITNRGKGWNRRVA